MSFAELAAARRTYKEFAADPVDRETLLALLDVARLAPNHYLTEPWRFRVLGPDTLARLKECAGTTEAAKLDRAPTLVVVSAPLSGAGSARGKAAGARPGTSATFGGRGELVQDEEDVCAVAAGVMLVLLAATERGLATYWRTPGILRTARGREAVGIERGERVLGLLHFGTPAREPKPRRERSPLSQHVSFLP